MNTERNGKYLQFDADTKIFIEALGERVHATLAADPGPPREVLNHIVETARKRASQLQRRRRFAIRKLVLPLAASLAVAFGLWYMAKPKETEKSTPRDPYALLAGMLMLIEDGFSYEEFPPHGPPQSLPNDQRLEWMTEWLLEVQGLGPEHVMLPTASEPTPTHRSTKTRWHNSHGLPTRIYG